MEQPATAMPITKDEFYKQYWFSPLQMVTLVNPKPYDYKFMVEMRNYIIRSNVSEKMPGTVANVYLSQMTRIMAQDDDRMQYLSDFALMKIYYDKLINNVESLITEDRAQPAYLANVPAHMKVDSEPETPPWQSPQQNTMPEPNSQMRSNLDDPKEQVKESTKEFELEGSKYKMVIDKNNNEMFFRDGRRVDGTVYSKAASMI